MKSQGNVATAVRRPGNGARDVDLIMSDNVSKMEEKRNNTPTPRLGLAKTGKTSLPTPPTKAPLEITNAIRRRQETTEIDYWGTLPPGPPQAHAQPQGIQQPSQPATNSAAPKPLYRAVLRGSLYGDNATTVCTLSSIVDAVNDREYNMVIRKHHNGHVTNGYHYNGNGNLIHNKNFSVVRAEDMGLTINGLSLTDMKASKTQSTTMLMSPASSPRGNGSKGYAYASFVKQGRQSNHQNANGNSNNRNNKSNSSFGNNNNNTEPTPNKNGKSNYKSTNLHPGPNNASKTIPRSPRLCLTNRQNNADNSYDSKRVSFSQSPRSDPNNYTGDNNNDNNSNSNDNDNNNHKNQDTIRTNTHNKIGLSRQTSLPLPCNETKTTMMPESNGNSNSSNSKIHHLQSTQAKRKFSNELENCKKLTKQDSLPNASSSSCIQFADSIISALTVDLNKMYSICQTKVRYAEFIEQSQPHRLDEADGQIHEVDYDDQNRQKLSPRDFKRAGYANSYNNNDCTNTLHYSNSSLSNQNLNPKEVLPSQSTTFPSSQSSSSTTSVTTSSQNLSSSKTSNTNSLQSSKTAAPLRLAPLTPKVNKYTSLREITNPELDRMTPSRAGDVHPDTGRTKATRPILKSSKTDIDTNNISPFRPACDKTDNNNNNNTSGMGSNRLVRFKVNHEVREFAPSEPVRYY